MLPVAAQLFRGRFFCPVRLTENGRFKAIRPRLCAFAGAPLFPPDWGLSGCPPPLTVLGMSKNVVPVEIRTVLPFNAGRAVFIGNDEKVFVIYVDESVGAAITMFMNDTPKERPLTHDLIGHLMAALGAKVERVIINDLKSETYFARLIISAENELFEKKIVELDGRPSDCIALAIQQKAPIYVSKDVWDEVEDRSDVLRQIEESEQGGGTSEET
jgi:bifunctional DNase/RNase